MRVHRLKAEKIAHHHSGGYTYSAAESDANMCQIAANSLASLIYLDSRHWVGTAEWCVAD
jgi:hypothetical protein